VAYLTALFSQHAWWKLVPETSHHVVTAGYGSYNANNENLTTSTYATTAWVPDGSLAIVYTPVSTTLTVDLAAFAGPVSAAWFDPTTGSSTAVSGSPFANSGSSGFATPSTAHSDGTHDWALVLSTGSGTPPDAGATSDAGAPPDAGGCVACDAGVPDAGQGHDGGGAPPDAGSGPDAGSPSADGGCCSTSAPPAGCGCAGTGEVLALLVGGLWLLALRTPRRKDVPCEL
jgi:hypothetical protein